MTRKITKKIVSLFTQNDAKQLERENKELNRQIERLQHRIEKLKKEKKAIKKEFKEYKTRHPTTVGVKNGKPYAFKSNTKSVNPKKPGARKGHKRQVRKMAEHIDEIVPIPIDTCSHCGGVDLSEDVQEIRTRVVEDIPVIKPIVTRYEIERRYCRNCKKLVEMPVTQALPKARIGIRAMLFVIYLKIKLRMPVNSIQKLLICVYGFTLSEGEVCLIQEQMAEAFGPYYSQLLKEIRNAPARYIDETSWRINGKNVWLWAFITKCEALYIIAKTRSHDVPLGVLGKKHNGVDVHDRFSAYKALAKKTKNIQQDCWAHILEDSKELARFYGNNGEFIHQVLKKIHKKALEFDHNGTDENIEILFQEMADSLDRPYSSMHCYKFVLNLLKEKDNLFEFVRNPDVDSTNNRAERGIRHSVVARKISGGSKSEKGAKIYGILTSVLHTVHQKGENILDYGPKIMGTSHG